MDSHATVEPLTRAERDVLAAVRRAIREHGSPTVREIATAAGPNFYSSTTHRCLVRLAVKGYIEMKPGKFRSIRLAPRRQKKTEMPHAMEYR
jgi:SOS-response transcriptional repressor LexA